MMKNLRLYRLVYPLWVILGAVISVYVADGLKGQNVSDTGVPMHDNSRVAFVVGLYIYIFIVSIPIIVEYIYYSKAKKRAVKVSVLSLSFTVGLIVLFTICYAFVLAFVVS